MSFAHAGNIFDAQMKQRADRAADSARNRSEDEPFQKSQQILSRRLTVIFRFILTDSTFTPSINIC